MRSNVSDLRHEINSLRKQINEAHSYATLTDGYNGGNTYEAIAQEISEPENLNLNDLSRVVLEKALERNNGNRKKTAIDLGISARTLYRRLKEFGIK